MPVVQRSLAVLHDQSIAFGCTDINIGVLRITMTVMAAHSGKVHKDTGSGTDLPSDSRLPWSSSLRPDQSKKKAPPDGSHVNSSEDVV